MLWTLRTAEHRDAHHVEIRSPALTGYDAERMIIAPADEDVWDVATSYGYAVGHERLVESRSPGIEDESRSLVARLPSKVRAGWPIGFISGRIR